MVGAVAWGRNYLAEDAQALQVSSAIIEPEVDVCIIPYLIEDHGRTEVPLRVIQVVLLVLHDDELRTLVLEFLSDAGMIDMVMRHQDVRNLFDRPSLQCHASLEL